VKSLLPARLCSTGSRNVIMSEQWQSLHDTAHTAYKRNTSHSFWDGNSGWLTARTTSCNISSLCMLSFRRVACRSQLCDIAAQFSRLRYCSLRHHTPHTTHLNSWAVITVAVSYAEGVELDSCDSPLSCSSAG
jgi:hypothetical protein